ncbi:MAG: 2-dehydro-3-deoxygalactonokinase [Balneolaceae bacterium]
MTKNWNISETHFLSCDWGTTSFRLKLAHRSTGRIETALEDGPGIQDTGHRLKELAKAQDREAWFLQQLQKQIQQLETMTGTKLGDLPLVLSGMASSSIGLRELPYGTLPMDLSAPKLPVEPIVWPDILPNPILLVSGLQSAGNDVMRGEETALIGIDSLYPGNSLCILPGTHSKHAVIENGKLIQFRTFMTGEIFDLLGKHSILRNSISRASGSHDPEVFRKGVSTSLDKPLLHSLFTIRAENLLKGRSGSDGYSFLSGLLIGSELQELYKSPPDRVFVSGNGSLQALYSTALKELSVKHTVLQPDKDLVAEGQTVLLNRFLERLE